MAALCRIEWSHKHWATAFTRKIAQAEVGQVKQAQRSVTQRRRMMRAVCAPHRARPLSTTAIANLSLDGRVLAANESFRALFLADKAPSRTHLLQICCESSRSRCNESLERLQRREADHVELTIRCHTSRRLTAEFDVSLSAVCDQAGMCHGLVAQLNDPHHETAADSVELLPDVRRQMQWMDDATIGIVRVDHDEVFQYANRRFCAMLGYANHEIVGRRVQEFIFADDQAETLRIRRELLRGDRVSNTDEKRFVRKDGTVIWLRRWLSAVHGHGDQPKEIIGALDDITKTRWNAERYAAMFQNAAVGITQVDLNGTFVDANDKFCAMLGYSRAELCGKPVRDITHPDDRDSGAAMRQRVMHDCGIPSMSGEKRLIRKTGELLYVKRTMSVVRDNAGAPVFIISVVEDVSDQKLAEEALRTSEETLRATFAQAGVGLLVSTPDLRIIQVNEKYCQMLGYTKQEANTLSIKDIVRPCDIQDVMENRKAIISGAIQQVSRERQLLRKDGSLVWVSNSTSLVRDENGAPKHFVTVSEDITDRKQAEEQLTQLAHYDMVTKLPNRALFYQRLKAEVQHTRELGACMAVLFVDLDRFKYVNDTLGHAAGDTLLQQVATRLRDAVRAHDTVGRLSGDEFAIIVANLKMPIGAQVVAKKVVESLKEPFTVEGTEIYVTASIGVTVYPADSDDVDGLMRNADAAMYRAKELGGNTYELFAPEMNVHAHAVLRLGNDLRRALEREEFVLHYQPKMNLLTGELSGFEALLRWQRPGKGLVMPGQFIGLLEETGLIQPVGQWAIEQACKQIALWRNAGLRTVPVAVNLSAKQFRVKHLARTIAATLEKTCVEPEALELEITENFLAHNPEEAIQVVEELGRSGIRVAIDDFGTGYSNLGQLKRFRVHTIKIDQTFVQDVTTDVNDAAIVRAIINMAHNLGLVVVAEGVERHDQLDFLVDNKCDEVQGYYLSYPQPPDECSHLLEDRHALRRRIKEPGIGQAVQMRAGSSMPTIKLSQRVT